jgi:AraC-like DNA-binding protein
MDGDQVKKNQFRSIDTNDLPRGTRMGTLRDFLARELMGVEITPIREEGFYVSVHALTLPDLLIAYGRSDELTCARLGDRLGDGQDDFMLDVMNVPMFLTVEGRWQVEVKAGDGLIYPLDRPWRLDHRRSEVRCMRLPRALLAGILPDLDSRPCHVIPRAGGALDLLLGYAELVMKRAAALPELQAEMSRHLVALATHAFTRHQPPAAPPESTRRALALARLDLIKADICRRLGDPALSVGDIAARFRMSPRNLQALFAAGETTFTAYLRDQRLLRAWRLLEDPARRDASIAAIAAEAGFSDLSHFNRAFRARFAASPRAVRDRGPRDRRDQCESQKNRTEPGQNLT